MLKEIGSNFWINLEELQYDSNRIDNTVFRFDYDDIALTSTGRGAIALVLCDLPDDRKKALLPSFTCESVIEPFIQCGYDVSFYRIHDDLTIDFECLQSQAETEKPTVVYFHRYFGFDTLKQCEENIQFLKHHGISIIEDTTHSLYSKFNRLESDYQIGSFRKWAALPDGGYALKKQGNFQKKPSIQDNQLVAAKLKAMTSKYEYMIHGKGSKETFLKQYAEAEAFIENQDAVYSMSDVSISIQGYLDIDELKRARRNNYQLLLDHIENKAIKPLFPCLPCSVTPLYFPLFCDVRRNELQAYLRENSIYAPIIWPQNAYSDAIKYHNEKLYFDMLCIPCDQRYGEEEMLRLARLINLFC